MRKTGGKDDHSVCAIAILPTSQVRAHTWGTLVLGTLGPLPEGSRYFACTLEVRACHFYVPTRDFINVKAVMQKGQWFVTMLRSYFDAPSRATKMRATNAR